MTTTEDQGGAVEENLSDETGPVGSPIWAAAHARHLLTSIPNKWAHTRQVVGHARWVASGIRPDDRDLLVAAAYLHDIGYDERIAVTGFHPLDGARHLRGLGLNELACLVAHHTGAHVEADHRGLADELAQFPRPTGPVADALTYCDVTSGPTGQAMDPGDRFEEIVDRHGPDSIVAHSRAEARGEMYGAVARTLRRATRRRPASEPLSVTPIGLGCVTLVRLQGALNEATAQQATQALRSVLDRQPHKVVVDLALLTGLDPSGARALTRAAQHADDTTITLVDPRGRDRGLIEQSNLRLKQLPIVYGIEPALTPHCT